MEFSIIITLFRVPFHKTELKVEVFIMLLRNLNPLELCNCRRWRVGFYQKTINQSITIVGFVKGDWVFMPKILIIPSNYLFQFKCSQFPVNVNRSPDQTLRKTGIEMRVSLPMEKQNYTTLACIGSQTVFIPDNLFLIVVGTPHFTFPLHPTLELCFWNVSCQLISLQYNYLYTHTI